MYVIYHFPGIKVGCTKDIDRRTIENLEVLRLPDGTLPEILEIVDGTIKEAGLRERYWERTLGYKQGWPYEAAMASAISPNHICRNIEYRKRWEAAGQAACAKWYKEHTELKAWEPGIIAATKASVASQGRWIKFNASLAL